jgi:DNA-binding NtrC family response regulator
VAIDPIVVVLTITESFANAWAGLAESARVGLRVSTVAEPLDSTDPANCAIVVALAGEETRCADVMGPLAPGAMPVAVVGAAPDHRIAVTALRSGAAEYFALPHDIEALRGWLVERASAWRARQQARAAASDAARTYDFSALIGNSPELRGAVERAARIIPRPAPTVLITGETGTGKELIARGIHYNGPRSAHPFVEINCTALPPTLLEAELFGYEKGAFTDARNAKPGLFEAASGGTLFLDEIGDLQPDLQVKLLRVLEDRQVRRVGALRSTAVDIRVIAATSVDLPAAVRDGRFRSDLYYRLAVVPIHLPPLRERGDDVILLAEHFLSAFSAMYDQPVPPLEDEVRRALHDYDWPGNVRELRNAIERAVLLGDGRIRVADLFVDGSRERVSGGDDSPIPFPATLDAIEQAAAAAMVERHRGNKSSAAAALGISRSRLYRLLGEG